jgi:hypothetical protein
LKGEAVNITATNFTGFSANLQPNFLSISSKHTQQQQKKNLSRIRNSLLSESFLFLVNGAMSESWIALFSTSPRAVGIPAVEREVQRRK